MSLKTDNLAGPGLAALNEMTRAAAAAKRAAGDHVGEMAASWVGPNYLLSLREELAARPEGPERFKLLRQATGEALSLQRGDTWSARVQIERDKLEFRQQQHRDKLKAEKAARRAETKAATQWRDPNAPMTDAELKACVDKVDEIMGLKKPSEEVERQLRRIRGED
jgi:hypothetical protein